jgi:hypothetical protein
MQKVFQNRTASAAGIQGAAAVENPMMHSNWMALYLFLTGRL